MWKYFKDSAFITSPNVVLLVGEVGLTSHGSFFNVLSWWIHWFTPVLLLSPLQYSLVLFSFTFCISPFFLSLFFPSSVCSLCKSYPPCLSLCDNLLLHLHPLYLFTNMSRLCPSLIFLTALFFPHINLTHPWFLPSPACFPGLPHGFPLMVPFPLAVLPHTSISLPPLCCFCSAHPSSFLMHFILLLPSSWNL